VWGPAPPSMAPTSDSTSAGDPTRLDAREVDGPPLGAITSALDERVVIAPPLKRSSMQSVERTKGWSSSARSCGGRWSTGRVFPRPLPVSDPSA